MAERIDRMKTEDISKRAADAARSGAKLEQIRDDLLAEFPGVMDIEEADAIAEKALRLNGARMIAEDFAGRGWCRQAIIEYLTVKAVPGITDAELQTLAERAIRDVWQN